MGTYEKIEISQDADNADQKVKWFLKVHQTYKHLLEEYFLIIFFLKFLFNHTFSKSMRFKFYAGHLFRVFRKS